MKCSMKTKNEDILRVRRFKKAHPKAQNISETTVLSFLDVEQRIKRSIYKKLNKILMLN